MGKFLSRINRPEDLRALEIPEISELAGEIREFLIDKVSATGGHLGPNLGVVELTLGLHRVFDSPNDAIIFDTGHQSYVHKIVTGRKEHFHSLRQRGGLSGYPSRAESEHDWVESSHASAALSYADGLARAFELTEQTRHVVAVVGDGALTGGMCWEALNSIAAAKHRPFVIVVNDNGRSYAPTIGGLADRLSALRMKPSYERVLATGKRQLQSVPVVGDSAYKLLHGVKAGLKDMMIPRELFGDLGLKYLGPVDGHDAVAIEAALQRAKDFGESVIVHAVTRKGAGYEPAETDEADQMHSCGVIDPRTGIAIATPVIDWTSVFSEELIRHGERRKDIVAITAAMAGPTGLAPFGTRFPDRLIDVGIAEQHALTSAAGLALGGMHPVVAVYSTFLNRAFDQLLMDVALLSLPVTLILDRAGITGNDGASHNGMWDLSLLGIVPGIRVAAPRDAATLRAELSESLANSDGPTALRFPKGAINPDLEAIAHVNGLDILHSVGHKDVLLVAVGAMASVVIDAAHVLREAGIGVTVVDPRWVLPVSSTLVKLAEEFRLIVTVEDGGVHGGVGSAVSAALHAAEIEVACRNLGIQQRFLDHATRSEILQEAGLTSSGVAKSVEGWLAEVSTTSRDGLQDAVDHAYWTSY